MAVRRLRRRRVVNLSFRQTFASIWAEIEAEDQLKKRWVETTPWILVRYPRWDRQKKIALTRLGRIHAWELTIPGPRGGKGTVRKTLDVFGTGFAWSKCDVRLLTPDVLRASEAIDRAIDALKRRREALFAEQFYDLDPLDWSALQEAQKPWHRIWEALDAYKSGKATKAYVQDVVRDVLTKAAEEARARSAPAPAAADAAGTSRDAPSSP